jgi:beta-lactamase regulating signal transducer with metallopeptidase domain
MSAWTQFVLVNAVSATLLAFLVAAVAPRIGRPSVVHFLWVLVLVELVAPPVFELGVLPSHDAWQRLSQSDHADAMQGGRFAPQNPTQHTLAVASARGTDVSAEPVEPGDAMEDRVGSASRIGRLATLEAGLSWLAVLAAAGTLVLLAVSLIRWIRFRRGLQDATEAPAALQHRLHRLATTFGLPRAPCLWVVAARIPPALWAGPGRCGILLPAGLLERLSEQETDALLSHELAHVRRRDHWLRPFELLVVALYWWHPVSWWARRRLRIAEEQACDAMVVQKLQGRPRDYAESLLKTIEFLAFRKDRFPSLATGAAGVGPLKERVTMILKSNAPKSLPQFLRLPLVVLLSLAVLVSPTWVEKASSSNPQQEADLQHQQELLKMQEQEVQLQREMQRIEQERRRVQQQIEDKMLERHFEEMAAELTALEAAGQQAEAQELRRRIAMMEREVALQRKANAAGQAMAQKRMQIEYELQDLNIQMQKAEMAGRLQEVQETQARVLELEQALRRIELEALQSELQLQRQRLDNETQQLEELQ